MADVIFAASGCRRDVPIRSSGSKANVLSLRTFPTGVCPQCGQKVVKAAVGRHISALIKDSKGLRKARTVGVPVIRFAEKIA